MIEEEIHARLSEWPGLRGRVHGRIYPLDAEPNSSFPYIVFSRESTNYAPTFDQSKDAPTALFSVDCYAATLKEARDIAALVRAALDGWNAEPPAALMQAWLENEEYARDDTARAVLLEFGVMYRK